MPADWLEQVVLVMELVLMVELVLAVERVLAGVGEKVSFQILEFGRSKPQIAAKETYESCAGQVAKRPL